MFLLIYYCRQSDSNRFGLEPFYMGFIVYRYRSDLIRAVTVYDKQVLMMCCKSWLYQRAINEIFSQFSPDSIPVTYTRSKCYLKSVTNEIWWLITFRLKVLEFYVVFFFAKSLFENKNFRNHRASVEKKVARSTCKRYTEHHCSGEHDPSTAGL